MKIKLVENLTDKNFYRQKFFDPQYVHVYLLYFFSFFLLLLLPLLLLLLLLLFCYRFCDVCAHTKERLLFGSVHFGESMCHMGWCLILTPSSSSSSSSSAPQFGWTHVTLFVLGSQVALILQNVFEGLFWFLLPVSMVVCNDITAYLFGERWCWWK